MLLSSDFAENGLTQVLNMLLLQGHRVLLEVLVDQVCVMLQ